MKTIKFSHEYTKLLNESDTVMGMARLIHVVPVDLADLPTCFLEYDTDFGTYPLPKKGAYLMLIFQKIYEPYYTEANNLFTTLRRSTPEKIKYYTGAIGDIFEVKIIK